MKRPIAAILLCVFLFAGVYAYTTFVSSISRAPLEIKESFSDAAYSARITRTCDLVGDAGYDIASLNVRYRNEDLISRENLVPQSEVIKIEKLDGVTTTRNEIYISANLKSSNDDWASDSIETDDWGSDESPKTAENLHAIRVEVFSGDLVIADKTIWQEPGSDTIAGSISFQGIEPQESEHDHE